jgi:5'-methylthioadenosine phosphorylase
MKIGIIGGSGLYEMDGLKNVRMEHLTTPFGMPSAPPVCGTLDGCELVFLPRHDVGHVLLPSEINYRANIHALKQLGVERIVSISAVGSMKEEIHPGEMVVVDQFIDRTSGRDSTFFGAGIVAHIPFADPVCPECRRALIEACHDLEISCHEHGTYICINGPQFSTRAESLLYRQWGVDVIGMTNLPEARLAREAGICYATLALATDYDCWHETHDDVSTVAVIAVIRQNIANARRIIRKLITTMPAVAACGCARALDDAVITHADRITPEIRGRLRWILPPKVMKRQ